LTGAVRDLGLHAPFATTSVNDKDIDVDELWPFYAKAEELKVPIIVHPVNTVRLRRVAADAPFCHARLRLLERYGNPIENSIARRQSHVRRRARRVSDVALLPSWKAAGTQVRI
jgi:hypothetical protein